MSVGAGAVKAALLVSASIIEAVLRVVAEARGYDLPNNPKHRTFGAVLRAWKENDGSPKPDIASHWDLLEELCEIRNDVHLFKAAGDPNAKFDAVLSQEQALLPNVLKAIDALAELKP